MPRNHLPHADEDRVGDRSLRLPWSRSSRRVARRVAQPLQAFLDAEASSGILLLVAAAVAVLWANSPWSGAYDALWRTVLTVRVGDWALTEDLRHWVNDGLMSLFFLVVGLEIKRELLTGELRDPRRAAVPVIAALGGMVVPAADLPGREPRRRCDARVGHPDGDGHRVRARGAHARREERAAERQAVPAHARDRGRHRRDPRDRPVLLVGRSRSRRSPSPPGSSRRS